MWGDSVHHTLIAQLLVDNHGLFDSWQPYAELQSLTYHFGLHANVAVFSMLSGLHIARATLLVGQFFNAFAVISLSPIAWRISNGNRWSTVATWILAGFVFSMPMHYTNWGRYTQLCGQIVLPVAFFMIWDLMETSERNERVDQVTKKIMRIIKARPCGKIFLVAILSSGLALIHYRVFIFLLGSIPVLLLFNLCRKNWKHQIVNLSLAGTIGFSFYLPWFLRLYGGRLFEGFLRSVTTSPSTLSSYTLEYNAIGDLSVYQPLPIWILFIGSIGWMLWRRNKNILLLSLWWIVIVLMANPNWIRLPGTGLLSNFAVFIAIYIPASLIIGLAITSVFEPFRNRNSLIFNVLGTLVVCVAMVLTGRDRLQDINPEFHALATNQDIRAMQWISKNTSPEARFLVNSFFAYGGSTIVGSDGGWWIPWFTKRKISVPPMPYVSEKVPFSGYVQYTNSLRQMIEEKGYIHPDVIAELKSRGYQYAYIGAKQGRVNYNGPVVMEAKQMIASGFYVPVYHKGDVWILEIK